MRLVRKLARDSRGATMIEYGLILALVFITMAVGFQLLAHQVVGTWAMINTKMPTIS